MIKSFRGTATEDIFDGTQSKAARKALPIVLHLKAHRLLDLINGAASLNDLAIPPGNRLEPLKGDRKGFHSIRINDQYRIVFRWLGADAEEVEIVDYH